MILVDDQSGSKDLFPYIKSLTSSVVLTRIDPPFGDIAWYGNGPNDTQLQIGVEYKKIDDVLTCMIDGRFTAHQLGGMIENYDRRYLLVEMGRTRFDRNTGVLQKMKGERWYDVNRGGRGFTMRDLEHWFTTVEEFTQTRVVRTRDEYQSARWVFCKYTWWTAKGYDEHKSLKQFHVPQPPSALLIKPTLVRRVAKEMTGVGWDKSANVTAKFHSVREMANANEGTWQEIDGIGKTMARRIVAEISGVNR